MVACQIPLFTLPTLTVSISCLPGWRADIFDSIGILKDSSHFFKRLTSSLWEHEKDMHKHGDAEYTKNDVGTPLNVDKCRWDEIAESEIERPIGRRGESDSLTTHAEWVEFGWVDP